MKVPHRYIEAPGMLTIGMWFPWTEYPENPYKNSPMYHAYVEHNLHTYAYTTYESGEAVQVSREAGIPEINKFFEWFFQNDQAWSKVPIMHLIWSGSFSTFLFVVSVFFVLYRKQRRYIIPLSLIFGMLLTVFLSPVVFFRYLFPIVLTAPIMFYIIIKCASAKR